MKGIGCYKVEARSKDYTVNTKQIMFRFCHSRSLIYIIIFSAIILLYMFKFSTTPPIFTCSHNTFFPSSTPNSTSLMIHMISSNISPPPKNNVSTKLQHIVFGIAASKKTWDSRKEYIKIWWRPNQMRGYIWLDEAIKKEANSSASSLPTIKISPNTSNFPYTHKEGSPDAVRITRIVSDTVRLNLKNVRWFVMGDDDTIFIPDNLIVVLQKLDHHQPYYIGSHSETHLQNIIFSYEMAYGGGGFAISKPLAFSLARMQDRCIRRYPALYGSDDRIHACMAELGVPLTPHPGFHQFDLYGDLLGLLAAHPIAPLVTLHHLDLVDAIFPNSVSRAGAIRRIFDGPIRLDSAGVMQHSICYDVKRHWTVSVSWGFVVEVVRGIMSPREMERAARTFVDWHREADNYRGGGAYAFNTRVVARNLCQQPFVYYMSWWMFHNSSGMTVTGYRRDKEKGSAVCLWKLPDPDLLLEEVVVFKKPDPFRWDKAPRRNCCRILPFLKVGNEKRMEVEVGLCRDGNL